MANENRYQGKLFSILGDSISTLEDWNPDGYRVFYYGQRCTQSGVHQVEDTWWGKVLSHFDGQLLVNNSWSGSRVTRLPAASRLFPSGCSDERTAGLHTEKARPDVIIIYLGINDYISGTRDETEVRPDYADDMDYFSTAYAAMLKKLRGNYPSAEIWCCTLPPSCIASYPAFRYPTEYEGRFAESYNRAIRTSAETYQCRLLDLYALQTPYDSIDGTHPTKAGMTTLANLIIRCVSSE